MRKHTWIGILSLALLLPVLAACSGANQKGDESEAATFLQIVAANDGDNLDSDVISDAGVVLEDSIKIEILNQAKGGSTVTLGAFNAVTITHYRVTFSRADGRAVPGVDVPMPFEANSSTLIRAGSSGSLTVTVVPIIMKVNSPLADLVLGGIIEATATIDISGEDQTGRRLKVTALLEITFANFAG